MGGVGAGVGRERMANKGKLAALEWNGTNGGPFWNRTALGSQTARTHARAIEQIAKHFGIGGMVICMAQKIFHAPLQWFTQSAQA